MGKLVDDAKESSRWIAQALTASGYRADYSLESLREIDRFFDEQSRNGEAVRGGLLSKNLGSRMFALGAYVAETILQACGGRWRADDNDPEGEIKIEVVLPDGTLIQPICRVMKRFQNGPQDGVYEYGRFAQEQAKRE